MGAHGRERVFFGYNDAQGGNPHDPANHGTNSYQPFYNEAFPGYNFGRCQSQTAKQSGPAKIAQVKNPAILTKGDPTMRVGSACPKG